MPNRHSGIAALWAGLVLSSVTGAAAAAEAWIAPGPIVGQPFPDALALPDQTGRMRALQELRGDRGTVIVFVRSADWCPFCMRQLADINRRIAQFRQLGLAVVSVSVDSVDLVAAFHGKNSIGFTMLADSTGSVAQAIGIRDAQYPVGSNNFGVPHPMIFVTDRAGVIRAKFAEQGYRKRPDLDRVLVEIGRLSL